MKPLSVAILGAAVAIALYSPFAVAQRPDPCLTAPVEGQKLQKAGKLLEAREQFGICARASCPTEIVHDCIEWARTVDNALPSIVVAARDAEGRDLVDVRVSMDGSPLALLGARATAVNPGTHRFVFQRSGATDVAQEIIVREGQKNREIVATFAPPPKPPSSSRPVEETERPVPTLTFGAAGAAVLGLSTFGTFGVLGLGERSRESCATGCTQSQSDSVNQKFVVADIGLAVGVVALGLAAWSYLSRPSVSTRSGVVWAPAGVRF